MNKCKRKEKRQKRKHMEKAIRETFKSVIGSSLTTIAGFLALCFMDLTLGKDIGIVMAKGVLFGLICVLTIFPSLLLVFDKYIEKTKHKVILPKFQKIQKFSLKHYVIILITFIIICIPAFYGNSHYDVYYKLDKSLPQDLPSSIANSNLSKEFNITSPEIILLDKNVPTYKTKELVNKLKNQKGIDLVLAPQTIEEFGIPSNMLPEEVTKIYQNDNYQLIILNSTYEVASDELNAQIGQIDNLVKEYDENSIIAGEGALTKDLVEIADHDFKVVNYLSIGVIFIIMLCVLKISKPTIHPSICNRNGNIYQHGNIILHRNITPIHCLNSNRNHPTRSNNRLRYSNVNKIYRRKIKNKRQKEAMEKTLKLTVPSIITSALCFFCATFGVAIYSQIDMIGSICNLLSRGAIISMLVVILVLPSLILIFDKLIVKTTKNMKEGV